MASAMFPPRTSNIRVTAHLFNLWLELPVHTHQKKLSKIAFVRMKV